MDYRRFEVDDLDLYLRWINQRAIWEVDSIRPYEEQTRASFGKRWDKIVRLGNSYMILVDGREIGFVGLKSSSDGELTGEFFIVIGEVEEWGNGHGTRAMGWLESKARSLGLSRLTGQVLSNNARALSLYRKLGYQTIDETGPQFERDGKTFGIKIIERVL